MPTQHGEKSFTASPGVTSNFIAQLTNHPRARLVAVGVSSTAATTSFVRVCLARTSALGNNLNSYALMEGTIRDPLGTDGGGVSWFGSFPLDSGEGPGTGGERWGLECDVLTSQDGGAAITVTVFWEVDFVPEGKP